jgi:HD-GYP domain-containing protein (c-di-GMP phosphodiesterase class II)
MARMLAVADAFDAMTSDRPYRCAMAVDAALIELQANAGKQFDPRLVEAFISSYRHVAQGEAA